MTGKNLVNVLIFTFAVLMVLLRPYAAYRISMRADFATNSTKVNSLLQRLIKKKEEHHSSEADHINAVSPSKTIMPLPVLLLLFLASKFIFLLTAVKKYSKSNTIFQISPPDKYYLRLSKIQL